MTYPRTLAYLFSQLPMYQRKGLAAYKSDIGNILQACKLIGEPHNKFNSIHVAGTNGKGSVSHMLASILQEAGYKVGLYTSPHLKDFRERIKINGKMISKSEVVQFVAKNKILFEKMNLSFFEFAVALTFNYFAKKKVDIAIIETGLGGRLDSTNIIKPILSIITNIGLDHTNLLGNTLEKIAKEKAGIIKHNTSVIIGKKQMQINMIFEDIANEKNAPLKYASFHKYKLDLKGNYQKENRNTAVSAIIELQNKGWKITDENIKNGLLNTNQNTRLLGRWQILGNKPLIICDTGHNEDGINQIFKQIEDTPHKNLHVLFGSVNDKDLDTILKLLPKHATYYFCHPKIDRAINANKLKKIAYKYQLFGNSFNSVKLALNEAKKHAKPEDLIFIGGSTFVVAELI